MKEELAIHEDPCTSLELFNLATKCARAEEGRLSLLELPAADQEEKKPKVKDLKRKGAIVLAAEPDTKQGRDQPESSKGSRYCVYHDRTGEAKARAGPADRPTTHRQREGDHGVRE